MSDDNEIRLRAELERLRGQRGANGQLAAYFTHQLERPDLTPAQRESLLSQHRAIEAAGPGLDREIELKQAQVDQARLIRHQVDKRPEPRQEPGRIDIAAYSRERRQWEQNEIRRDMAEFDRQRAEPEPEPDPDAALDERTPDDKRDGRR